MGNKNDTSSFMICSLMQKKPNIAQDLFPAIYWKFYVVLSG